MINHQSEFPDPNITAACDVYLTELNIRISKMRELHSQMESKNNSVKWLKQLINFH